MKLQISLILLFTLSTASLGLGAESNNNDEKELVSRAIAEATAFHEQAIYNATIRGAQTKAKRRGGDRNLGDKSTPMSEEISRISNIYKVALDILTSRNKMERPKALSLLTKQMPAACQQPQANCNAQINSIFRTIDGTCNNIQRPFWGAINQALSRVAQANYENGVDEPRGGRQRLRLPNPRLVSTTIHPDADFTHASITNMLPQFGQFLDHDITSTPQTNRMCCTTQQSDPDCWPISIPNNDPFYTRVSRPQTCMDFTRSTAFCFPTTGVREQMNSNTAFIDGSQIYGSTTTRFQQLRTFGGGLLKTNGQLNGFLPTTAAVNPQLTNTGTFIAGDDRINEMPALAVMHNLFLMEHNRLAQGIRALRPSYSDETIFQIARRIVGAELQNIAYNEYLPLVLGGPTMNEYSLGLGGQTTYSTYQPNTDPTIFNSFATAAYRFGHSLVNGLVRLISNGRQVGSYLVRDNYGQSQQLTQSNGQGYDWIIGGLLTQNAQQFDPFVTADMTNFLFKPQNSDFGSDLVARNIQRGRDHGLPPYNTFRSLCGLQTATSWTNKPIEIRADAWARLQGLYASPNDIDLFTGALTETPVANALSGPTFNCLMAVQFARLKFGDRYFFTHASQAGSFSSTQLSNLRSRTLGDIICENSQQVQTQRNVFLVQDPSNNPYVPCNSATRSKINLANFV